MLFRNLTLFRFPVSLRKALDDLDQHLPEAALKPVGPLELSSRGFVSPFGRGEDQLSHRVGDCVLITLGGEDKLLPSAVVNEALASKLDQLREREGRSPGGRERKRLKDEVLTDLLPRAFARPSRTNAYLDLGLGWLVVDSASRKNAEAVASALREALGSFPALPVNAESSPRALLTAWISGEEMPKGFELGDECELRDPKSPGTWSPASRRASSRWCWTTTSASCMGEDLVVRKFKLLDGVGRPARIAPSATTWHAELDARFALMAGEFKRLFNVLEKALKLSKADA
jgi:recombination associated protein RdgC